MKRPYRSHYRWIGALIGAVGAVVDTLLLSVFGVDMTWQGRDMTLVVAAVFVVNMGLMGTIAGWLMQVRRELEESRRRAVELETLAAIGRMAAQVAHEVRNPLAVIRSSAALVREELTDDDDNAQAFDFIVEEVDQLERFISTMLDFSRPIQPRPETVEAAELCERAIAVGSPQLTTHQVECTGHATLHADPDLVSRIVLGLLINAGAALRSPGHIRISSHVAPDGPVIRVSDDGPGVPESDRGRLFEPFFTTRADGTGLGLAIARKIARAHGGDLVHVANAGLGPGASGAAFELRLPIRCETMPPCPTP